MLQQIVLFLILFVAVFYLTRRSYLKYVKNKKSCESCAFHSDPKTS